MAKPRKEFYGAVSVDNHIRRHHPGCPEDLRAAFVAEIAGRKWQEVTLGAAFGIVATNYVRHRMTDYDRLLRDHSLTRDEARLVVAKEVQDIIKGWKARPSAQENG